MTDQQTKILDKALNYLTLPKNAKEAEARYADSCFDKEVKHSELLHGALAVVPRDDYFNHRNEGNC